MPLPGVIRHPVLSYPPDIWLWRFSGSKLKGMKEIPSTTQPFFSGDIGVTNDSSDNAYNVVIPSNGSLLDGFTVRDGNASQNYGDARGWGAWFMRMGLPLAWLTALLLTRSRGGAVFLQDANATFSNCTFSNNYGTAWRSQIAMDMQGL